MFKAKKTIMYIDVKGVDDTLRISCLKWVECRPHCPCWKSKSTSKKGD